MYPFFSLRVSAFYSTYLLLCYPLPVVVFPFYIELFFSSCFGFYDLVGAFSVDVAQIFSSSGRRRTGLATAYSMLRALGMFEIGRLM